MKFKEISIKYTYEFIDENNQIVPEKSKEVNLIRDENKLWYVVDSKLGVRGLYPSEIDLANKIQVEIIHKNKS